MPIFVASPHSTIYAYLGIWYVYNHIMSQYKIYAGLIVTSV